MTSPVSPSLPVLRQLLNEATSGVWHVAKSGGIDAGDYDTVIGRGDVDCMAYCYGGSSTLDGDNLPADAAWIVAMHNAAPALLDRLERQAAAIEAVQAEMQNWAKRCPEDDWGSGDIADMVLADAGRHVLSKIEKHLSGITPTTEEKA